VKKWRCQCCKGPVACTVLNRKCSDRETGLVPVAVQCVGACNRWEVRWVRPSVAGRIIREQAKIYDS